MTTTQGAGQARRESDVKTHKLKDEVKSAAGFVRAAKIFKKARNSYEAPG